MIVTLSDLLPLVGRLDSAPGFDTPRERFRRFLLENVTDVATARSLIDECQRSVGEQRHRALQDLVALVGRFLGFEITFGTYERSGSAPPMDGVWRSRGLLDVVLELRTEQTRNASVDSLHQALTTSATLPRIDPYPRIGLAVVARHFASRSRLEDAFAAEAHGSELRIVAVRSLLTLAEHVASNRLSHVEAVKLLQSGFALDFVIGLLDRPSADLQIEAPLAPPSSPTLVERREPAFWVATILGNETADADTMLASVIAHRRVLGICHAGPLQSEGAPGDWVCFFVPDKGMVGHAQLASVVTNSASVVRNASVFDCVYRLSHVELYDEPIVQALRAGRPFAVPLEGEPLAGPCLAPIERQDFIALTRYREDVPIIRRASA
jgi:hypothetical protein